MSKGRNRMLGLGLIVGATAGYWLNTKQGKTVRRKALEGAQEMSNQAVDYVGQSVETAKESIKTAANQGGEMVGNLRDRARETMNNLAEKV